MIVLQDSFLYPEYQIHNKLQPRILKKVNQHIQTTLNLSCHSCGNVFPIYEAHIESEIKDSLETIDNPFESQESVFMSIRKGKRKNRLNNYKDEDPDIKQELKKGNIVNT